LPVTSLRKACARPPESLKVKSQIKIKINSQIKIKSQLESWR